MLFRLVSRALFSLRDNRFFCYFSVLRTVYFEFCITAFYASVFHTFFLSSVLLLVSLVCCALLFELCLTFCLVSLLRTVFFDFCLTVCCVSVLCTIFFDFWFIVCYDSVFRIVLFEFLLNVCSVGVLCTVFF